MSQLSFDPSTGLVAPETADIREAVQQDWQAAFADTSGSPQLDVESATPAGQLIDAETAEIAAKNTELLWLANQFNPRVAEGRFQDALGYIYFLTRKIAEPTVVTCQLTGLRGTQIPYGAIAQNTDGYQLVCNAPVVIGDNGTAETTFRLAETGPIQIAAGTVTKIVTVIAGWDTINNEAAGATGRDVESRNEFEGRRYNSVAANAHGTVASLYGTISDIEGVLDCKVLENPVPDPVTQFGVEIGGHSVAVCVYGGEDSDIAQAIYKKKDAGCGTSGNYAVTYYPSADVTLAYTYQIVRPETVTFAVQVAIPNASALSQDTQNAIAAAVVEDFLGRWDRYGNTRVGLASTVYASRFYPVVMDVEGVIQLSNIQIKLGDGAFADSVTINADEEPVMTVENVTIVEG